MRDWIKKGEFMGATTFIYITNIALNFISTFPFIFLISSIFYISNKFIFTKYESLPELHFAYISFSKHCLLMLITFISILILIPSRELILSHLEFSASEIFDYDTGESLKFYEFLNRIK
jgi:hypothetical protein